MKQGLVLEGGAMRGLFTAGILDVLMEAGVTFDGVIGVSAGAAFGANYKSGQAGRVLRYNLRFAKDKRFCSLHSLLKTGDLYGGEFCYHTLPEKLDLMDAETYNSSPMKFYCVCTDADTAAPVYHDLDRLDHDSLEWVRASASMPAVSKPVVIEGRRLLDGGIADPVPVDFFRAIGYRRPVVILTQPKGYRKKPQAGMPVLKQLLKEYPAIAEGLANRHELYNRIMDKIDALEEQGEIFVMRPASRIKAGRTEHDRSVIREVYLEGRKAAEAYLPQLQAFLQETA